MSKQYYFIDISPDTLKGVQEVYHDPRNGGPRMGGVGSNQFQTIEVVRYNALRCVHREVCRVKEPFGWKTLVHQDRFYRNHIQLINRRAKAIQDGITEIDPDVGVMGENPRETSWRDLAFPLEDGYKLNRDVLKIRFRQPGGYHMDWYKKRDHGAINHSDYYLPLYNRMDALTIPEYNQKQEDEKLERAMNIGKDTGF